MAKKGKRNKILEYSFETIPAPSLEDREEFLRRFRKSYGLDKLVNIKKPKKVKVRNTKNKKPKNNKIYKKSIIDKQKRHSNENIIQNKVENKKDGKNVFDVVVRNISNEILTDRIGKLSKYRYKSNKPKINYLRSRYIVEYAKRRANGYCQLCKFKAPFIDKYGQAFLECHHLIWLSNNGEDAVNNVVALCPNCHAKMHHLELENDLKELKVKALEKL
jgi:5-methylcytosine-specific restriction protein A